MSQRILSAMLVVAGLIHVVPLSGVVGGERLGKLYGLALGEPNLQILMRHRAVLFGLLGVYMIWAAFRPAIQDTAILAGLISVVSFMVLAWAVGDYNAEIRRIVLGDAVALVCLLVAAGLRLFGQR